MAVIVITFLVVLIVGRINAASQKSEQYCSDIYSKTFSLDNPTSVVEEFPFMAAIGYKDLQENISWRCSGVLISEKYVLTAAHCLQPIDGSSIVHVKFGISNLNYTNDDDIIQTINISKLIRHPDFKRTSYYNDVGLIELQQPIKLSKHVKPICLEIERKYFYPLLITASLGILEFGKEPRKNLKRFNVMEYTNEKCRNHFKVQRRLKDGVSKDSMICVGNRHGSPCVESGNPLIVVDQTYGYRVVGMATFGTSCKLENITTAFYRVFHYIGWIESVVWP